jgi:hypothetical protein
MPALLCLLMVIYLIVTVNLFLCFIIIPDIDTPVRFGPPKSHSGAGDVKTVTDTRQDAAEASFAGNIFICHC